MIQELEGSSSKNGAVESVCRQAFEKIDQILNFLLIETEGHQKKSSRSPGPIWGGISL